MFKIIPNKREFLLLKNVKNLIFFFFSSFEATGVSLTWNQVVLKLVEHCETISLIFL